MPNYKYRFERASSTQFTNSFGVRFNGLLAELPTILEFFPWLGVVESHEVAGKNMPSIDTSIRTHGCCK